METSPSDEVFPNITEEPAGPQPEAIVEIPPSPDPAKVASQFVLGEFDALRQEILRLDQARDASLALNVAPIGAIIGAFFGPGEEKRLILLGLPLLSPILGWYYIEQNYRIRHASEYIRDQLSCTATTLSGGLPVLMWEQYLDRQRQGRPKWWPVVNNAALFLFVVPAVIGLIFGSNCCNDNESFTVSLMWALGLFFTGVFIFKHVVNQIRWSEYHLGGIATRVKGFRLLPRVLDTISQFIIKGGQ